MAYEPWQPGMLITANRLLAISPTWQDWVPAWSTSTGSNLPSFGDATVTARYAVSALTVYWRLEIAFGTTTNFGGGGGSDNWQFSAPVTAAAAQLVAGSGEAQDTDATLRVPLRARLLSTTRIGFETSGGATDGASTSSGLIDSVTPFTWASGDFVRAWGTYEAAA